MIRLLLIILFLAAAADPALARPALDKPNLIIIFLDDGGYGDFSHTGNPSIHTPNVSRLVNEGLNFPQFYTASGACTASRYSLLTARNPARCGFGTWVVNPSHPRYLHPNEFTLAEGLKAQGYATAAYGKWHLGNPNPNNGFAVDSLPLAHGFDDYEGTSTSKDYNVGGDLMRSNPSGNNPVAGYEMIAEDIEFNIPIHETLTERYRDRGLQFIEDNKDNPFFLYLPLDMPHLAVHVSDPFKGTSLRGLYGDCIEEIDAMVGSVVEKVEEQGIAQNTLIIVTSDNGPWIRFQDTVSHPDYGEARMLIGSALPFRDGKGSTWEGGVRVPGVWYWPGTIAPGSVIRKPVSTMDILPTFLKLAGGAVPEDRALDGRDVRPYLNSTLFPGTVEPFEFVYTGASNNGIYAARKGPWKLHIRLYSQTGNNYGFSASEANPLLFNVETDPHERFDRSDQEPDQVAALRSLINSFRNSLASEGTYWD